MSYASDSIERARLRRRIAQEVIDWCRRLNSGRPIAHQGEKERTAAALQLHDLHARHARQLGDEATAAKAEDRFDRELDRSRRA